MNGPGEAALPPRVGLATGRQVAALQAGFRDLGYGVRRERLTVAARVLGVDRVGSFNDLSYGQAGWLFGLLRHGQIPAAGRSDQAERLAGRPRSASPAAGGARGQDREIPVQDPVPCRWADVAVATVALLGAAAWACRELARHRELLTGQAR